MTEDTRAQALEQARALEKQGQIDLAVRQFLRAGFVADAARVLAGAKRYADAGHLVMDSLGVGPQLVGGLDAEKRNLAGKAATCFAQAGDFKRAIELFLALGELAKAADAAERSGDLPQSQRIRERMEKKSGGGTGGSEMGGAAARTVGARLEQNGQLEAALQEYVRIKALPDAARVAYKLKHFAQAAQLFDEAAMPFEAAACFAESGDKRRCLDCALRVPREHPKYRVAAAQAIRVATELDALDYKLDQFVAPFVSDGPKDERELEALYVLARLYRAGGFGDNARDVFVRIAAARPGYRDVADHLAKLANESRGARISAGNQRAAVPFPPDTATRAALQNDDFFPELPDLPAPPLAPAAPPKASNFALGPAPRRMSNPGFARTQVQPPSGHLSGQMPAVVPVATPPAALSATPVAPVAPVAAAPAPAPASSAVPGELSKGSMVAEGRYRVEAKIGQGGMAAVYRVMDLELGEEIAMKLFLQPSDDPQLLARFKQELTLSRGLAHPNIVRLYDIGQHQGLRFLTMELLHGTDLDEVIGGRPLAIGRGIRYLTQICEGMALAHDKGVVHRDIKPANFFVTQEDIIKVMDFGIAKRTTQAGGGGLTRAGFVAGTPSYMSPEQINNFTGVNWLTDMYALGVVAYEMFTGSVPFDHEELMQLLMMHLTKAPTPPSARNEDIPPELEAIILQLLEKDPGDRIQSCHSLGERLRAIKLE
jgi:serine/threonine-protein kinase